MKKLILLLLFAPFVAFSQQLGATFCWQDKELEGGHPYLFNQSIVKSTITEKEWWENLVEEVDYAGLDYIALLSRGTTPGKPDRGAGDPNHIPLLIDAMNTRAVNSFKLAIFDDCPNSWTSGLNYDLTGSIAQTYKFDCGNPDYYKYIWDYNLKIAIEKIPDERRYKIDGRMVIIFWSVKDTWMTNIGNGNLEKIMQHIRTKCFETFGFYPYLVTMRSWFDRDASLLNSTSIDAVHDWFSASGNTSFTNYSWTHRTSRQIVKTGCCVPGFSAPDDPDGRQFLDPSMGTSDKGMRLKTGLQNTVKAGAALTLVEGFTDAAEYAALWRSTDDGKYSFYEYPNQRLNILRSYSQNPYPAIYKMETEASDDYSDSSVGNAGAVFLHLGNLDLAKCNDLRGGWNVTSTQAGEWIQWRNLPLLTSNKFQLRYKSESVSAVNVEVDGTVVATTNLPSTDGLWATAEIGRFSSSTNSLHTVRLNILSGSPDLNYLTRIQPTVNPVTSVVLSASELTIEKKQSLRLTASILPSNAENTNVTWVSDNPKVAIVDADGKVTAVGPGKAKVYAITYDGEKTASCSMTVPGTIYLDECDALTGWNSSQGLLLNTTIMQQGSGCVEFTGSTVDEFKKVFSPAYNSGTTLANGALRFWYYVSDASKCGPVRVEIGSAGRADANEYSWQLTGLTSGWNLINLRMSNSTKVGTCDLNAINWFRIYDSKSGSITTRIDAIEVYDATATDHLQTNLQDEDMLVYQNTKQHNLVVAFQYPISSPVQVDLFDLSGRLLKSNSYASNNQKVYVDLSNVIPGMYVVKVRSNTILSTKIVHLTK